MKISFCHSWRTFHNYFMTVFVPFHFPPLNRHIRAWLYRRQQTNVKSTFHFLHTLKPEKKCCYLVVFISLFCGIHRLIFHAWDMKERWKFLTKKTKNKEKVAAKSSEHETTYDKHLLLLFLWIKGMESVHSSQDSSLPWQIDSLKILLWLFFVFW